MCGHLRQESGERSLSLFGYDYFRPKGDDIL